MFLPAEIFVLIIGPATTLVVFSFIYTLSRNYFKQPRKKRSHGQALLIWSFLACFIADIFLTSATYIQTFGSTETILLSKILMQLSIMSMPLIVFFTYYFGIKSVLYDDNFFIQMLNIIPLASVWGFLNISALIEIINNNPNPIYYQVFPVSGTKIFFMYPSLSISDFEWTMIISIILAGLSIMIYLRIIFRSTNFFRIARRKIRIEKMTNKIVYQQLAMYRGVLISYTSFLLTGISLSILYFTNRSSLMILALYSRGLFMILAVIFGYLGYMFPEWYLNLSGRGKKEDEARISFYLEGKLPIKQTSKPISYDNVEQILTDITARTVADTKLEIPQEEPVTTHNTDNFEMSEKKQDNSFRPHFLSITENKNEDSTEPASKE